MKTSTLRDAISIALLVIATGTTERVLAQESPSTITSGRATATGSQVRSNFDLPAGELAAALDAFGTQSGVELVFEPEQVTGRQASAVSGHMDWQSALGRLLRGSGLQYRRTGDRSVVIEPAGEGAAPRNATARTAPEPVTQPTAPAATELAQITVTGTRIRGGTTPSPVITIGSEHIREEGFADLGEVIRSVPQNFGGGQNPGVMGTSGGAGHQDVSGGSALNLRGLGPDASLTLLNGRRLAYDGFAQAVDISAIPVEAVERLDIVPDGASAIYGSDAVGGVANVILARDFDGLALGVRYGVATDGGLATREYTATAGSTWSTGGVIVTLKDASADPIRAEQRRYTSHLDEPYTIYNTWDTRSGLASLHQRFGDRTELRLDALRTERETTKYYPQTGGHVRNTPDAFVSLVAPSVEFSLAHDWSLTLGAARGRNEAIDERHVVTASESRLGSRTGLYNRHQSYELGVEGPLFSIGGDSVRLAAGVGSRTDDFLNRSHLTGEGYGGEERARHAYAEFSLPLVSPSSRVAGIRRLEFNAAARTEDYDSFGRVTTPKLGVVYSPGTDLTLKASWGRSFKAPTASQRYQDKMAYLWAATDTGGEGYPADATVLMSWGGNLDLAPERARTWTASLALHPMALPGLEVELTTFGVDYTDRVVVPVNYQVALSDPVYAEFVALAPTPGQQADLLAVYDSAFYNLSGTAYDPDNVVAIVSSQFLNAARQVVKGVDLSGTYRFDVGTGRLTLRGSASWLDSVQKTSARQPEFDLSGTVFNPAKVNGRVGAVWSSGGFTASGFANYTAGVTNRLAARTEKTASFTTWDATLHHEPRAWPGLTLGLAVQNLLDRDPPLYTVRNASFVPYDATNYSPIGRFVSVSVSKRW
ncbi:TonB-dependent receptor domain-containing protein [Luteimonas sp. R10]|uniref:TonB-dependent receptor domain-containing protein n=1 Tax=Luteimonas sp. R10 TaxID=3108176 RepID=UPI00308FD722|nr:TonB-dependent receptor [Luteimonas sp. R10]